MTTDPTIQKIHALDACCVEAMKAKRLVTGLDTLLTGFAAQAPEVLYGMLFFSDRQRTLLLFEGTRHLAETLESAADRLFDRLPKLDIRKTLSGSPCLPEDASWEPQVIPYDGEPVALLAVAKDRSPEQQTLLELFKSRMQLILVHFHRVARASSIDHLTGVYNRHFFDEQLDKVCLLAARHDVPYAIALIDLDRFKAANDAWGHPAGDTILRESAKRLAACVRTTDILARVGGDEFALLLNYADIPSLESLGSRILGIISDTPFVFEGRSISITTSVGIVAAEPGEKALQAQQIYQQVDDALRSAKRAGGNTSITG